MSLCYNRAMNTQRKSELLLAAVIIARSTSFMFSKVLLRSMGQYNLLGVRSLLAFVFLAIVFNKRLGKATKKEIKAGFIFGTAFFIVMSFELAGLKRINSSTMSFLENTSVVFVPVFMALITQKLPEKRTVLRVLIAAAGVALLTLDGAAIGFGFGELLGLCAAMCYACAIIVTKKFSAGIDTLLAGVFQVGTMGVLSIIASFIFETPVLPQGPTQWGAILYLAIICSGFGFTLQPVAQSGTTAERAGTFCALSPVSAGILGMIFLHESFGPLNILGAAMVICSILI